MLTLLLCLFTAMPATGQAGEPVSIEIGNLATMSFAKEWLDYEIAAFMKGHPEIKVVTLSYSEPFRDDFPLHENTFLPRNIVGLDSRAGAEAAFLAEKGEIVPIDSFLPDPGFDKSQFYDNYWDAVTYAGKIWGVPWQVWTDMLVCDMEQLAAAGIAEPPKTFQEMMDMVPRLTNLAGQPEQFGLRVSAGTDSVLNLLMALAVQKGGKVLEDNKFTSSDPEVRSALVDLMQLLLDTPSVNLHGGDINKFEYPERRYAMTLVETRHIGLIMGQKKYRIVPIPTITNDSFVCFRRLYFSVRRSTPAEEKASWELIKWLVRKDVSIPAVPLGYPCRKDIVERPEFKALMEKGPQGLDVLFTSTQRASSLGIFVLNRSRALRLWGVCFYPLLKGSKDFDGVMAEAAREANQLILPLPSFRENVKKNLAVYE